MPYYDKIDYVSIGVVMDSTGIVRIRMALRSGVYAKPSSFKL